MKFYDPKRLRHKIALLLAGAFFVPSFAWGLNTVLTGYQIDSTTPVTINAHSVCHKVSTGGEDYFVPTKSSTEWSAFRSNKPTDVTLNTCVTLGGPTGCGGGFIEEDGPSSPPSYCNNFNVAQIMCNQNGLTSGSNCDLSDVVYHASTPTYCHVTGTACYSYYGCGAEMTYLPCPTCERDDFSCPATQKLWVTTPGNYVNGGHYGHLTASEYGCTTATCN